MQLEFTRSEHQNGFRISVAIAAVGALMVFTGDDSGFRQQGAVIAIFAAAVTAALFSTRGQRELSQDHLNHYYDAPIKAGIFLSLLWAIGMHLFWWQRFDCNFLSCGAANKSHTTGRSIKSVVCAAGL